MDPVSSADEPGGIAGDGGAEPIAPGSLGPHPERHPDDLPPADHHRTGLPAGVLWALALAIVVLTIACWVAFSTDSQPDAGVVRLGDPNTTLAPPGPGLGLEDVTGRPASSTTYTTFDGGTASVAGHTGKPVVLNFWASTCTPCILEMPAFERANQAIGDDVTFVGLAVTDPESMARGLAERTGVTYELGFDPTGEIIRQFGSTTLPTTVFIDANGTIVDTSAGELDDAEIRDGIRTHFGIEVPEGP